MRTSSERAPSQTAIVVYGVGGALALVGLWWSPKACGTRRNISCPRLFPCRDWLRQSSRSVELVLRHLARSPGRLPLLATLIGFALALMLHLWAGFARLAWPVVLLIQLTPQVAFAPLLILWFGIGLASKIAMAASVAFFPVVINTFIGLRSVDYSTRELAYAMRVGRVRSSSTSKFRPPCLRSWEVSGSPSPMPSSAQWSRSSFPPMLGLDISYWWPTAHSIPAWPLPRSLFSA